MIARIPKEDFATRVALVTCAELPDLDEDTQRLVSPLAERGISALPAVWNDPFVNWSAFDLAVVRSCWDYAHQREAFLSWTRRVPRLMNPADVLAWNTDKRYLMDLAASGVPTVSTTWVLPEQEWIPLEHGEWVIKPAVSLAGLDTGRYQLQNPDQYRLARDHMRRLQQAGRTAMVQPYLAGVDTEGETAMIFLGGEFSHALSKGTILNGPDAGIDRRFQPNGGQSLHTCQPTKAQFELAQRTLDAVPYSRDRLMYARVDVVPGPDGSPVLMELELTEPMLYFGHVPEAAHRMAAVIVARARNLDHWDKRIGKSLANHRGTVRSQE